MMNQLYGLTAHTKNSDSLQQVHCEAPFFATIKCGKIQSLWNSFGIILNEFTRGEHIVKLVFYIHE